jgi:hypothetical protein
MEKTRQETPIESLLDDASGQEKELRQLKDLELLLVGGGGDDIVAW